MKTSVAAAFALLVLANAWALAKTPGPSRPFPQLSAAPEKARARDNPLARDPDAVAAGRKLFERHCAECHGANGRNGRKGPDLAVPEVQGASDGALFWALTNGNVRAGMPVWSKLPEPQRWQLTAFLKSLGVDSSEPPAPGPAPGR